MPESIGEVEPAVLAYRRFFLRPYCFASLTIISGMAKIFMLSWEYNGWSEWQACRQDHTPPHLWVRPLARVGLDNEASIEGDADAKYFTLIPLTMSGIGR